MILVLAIALLGAVSAAPHARAMCLDPQTTGFTSLATLADGGSLSSKNGDLVFDDFEVIATGSVHIDLGYYSVIALDDGFAIAGPIAAADGQAGDLLIRYTVTSSSPITEASLAFNGVASGKGSSASVVETYDQPVDIEMFVFATGEGGRQRQDRLNLEGFTQLRVTKDILVDSKHSGDFVAISLIEQRFKTAPEPAALLLLGSALLGIAVLRRCRA